MTTFRLERAGCEIFKQRAFPSNCVGDAGQLFTTLRLYLSPHYSSLSKIASSRNVTGILLTLFGQSTTHKGSRRYRCVCVGRVRVRNHEVEASRHPVEAASSSFSRPVLMRQALWELSMVVSRMLTRHRHEPRARLRSATSGTAKRHGAANWATSIPKCSIHGRFCGLAFPKGLHSIRMFFI